ncbi:hypothetical protein CANARDRAFT_28842 [[Candida] arabinofermentans NRRL YB-2248]|uniref:sphinganine-1-phosphate aldolase n=1 Tax=[Candida] arabinofermentans NRRL YB-2248 TaxID=983967 RepID=A0A1E4SYX2_9ASCO|nr:hypothetical protein CANARDRAFT_28842 [[Candida] arabinofermentans NRRL YB-2248]
MVAHNIPYSSCLSVETLLKWGQLIEVQILNYISEASVFTLLKDFLLITFIFRWSSKIFNQLYGYGIFGTIKWLYTSSVRSFYKRLLQFPPLKRKVDAEVRATTEVLETELIQAPPTTTYSTLPSTGLSEQEVLSKLDDLNKIHASDWKSGRLSGAVYHGGEELISLQTKAFEKYAVSNQLHPDCFPGVRQMESEVVSMVLKLFNAPSDTGCGTTTSGGTESLLLACLSAREKARVEKGITEPEIIAPSTIHAAVFKAAKYFKMNLKLVDLDSNYQVDIKQVKRLINKNTCLLMGSAPNFPHGIIDDISSLSQLATKHDIPLHVDCCLGSFVIAYYSKSFHIDLPPFDFRLPGVTSISCDTHKYGFAPKGSSIIMYRSQNYRKYQYYVSTDWIGGLYGSPTLAGSRPGALTVGAWATLIYMGDNGYIQQCQDIVMTSMKLKQAIKDIPELDVIGDPVLSVVSFKSDKLNVHKLGDLLSKRGWHLSSLQNPPALHLAATRLSVPVIDELISDIKECVKIAVESGEDIKSDTAQLYGVANSLSTGSVADRLIEVFLDTLYKTGKSQ